MEKIMIFLFAMAIATVCMAQNQPSNGAENATELIEPESDQYDTSDLLQRSIDGYRECIHYCVTKLEIRVEYYGYYVNVIVAPVIAHNNPDMLIMTTRTLGDEAYEDWGDLTAKKQREIQLKELTSVTGIATEAFGGQTEFAQYGRHQSTSFLESEIIANPTIVISQAYGREPYNIIGHESGIADAGKYGTLLGAYQPIFDIGASGFDMNTIANEALDYFGATGLLDDFQQISDLAEAASAAASAAAGYSGASFEQDSYMCESEATLFWPYYLSSIDSVMWRGQYPLVDGLHSGKFFSKKNQVRPTGAALLEDWGWIYPRTGFLNNDYPGRTAAVLSKRAAVIAGDADVKGRLRIQTPHSHIYQKISPKPSKECNANIADLDSSIDGNQAFSYNTWIRVECPTTSRGILVATVDIPDICIEQ